jgi:hypothetical protein
MHGNRNKLNPILTGSGYTLCLWSTTHHDGMGGHPSYACMPASSQKHWLQRIQITVRSKNLCKSRRLHKWVSLCTVGSSQHDFMLHKTVAPMSEFGRVGSSQHDLMLTRNYAISFHSLAPPFYQLGWGIDAFWVYLLSSFSICF